MVQGGGVFVCLMKAWFLSLGDFAVVGGFACHVGYVVICLINFDMLLSWPKPSVNYGGDVECIIILCAECTYVSALQ